MLGRFNEGVRFMATTIPRRAYWGVLTMVFVLVFSIGLFAQSRPTAAPATASSVAPDLNSTLAELMRVVPATNQDLAILQQQGGKLRRVTFWRGDNAHRAQMSEALRRNLQFAVPSLIHDTQASGGSLSTTFKLYRDLTAVCESLDSLLPPGSRDRKTQLTALNDDLSDMNRVREDLYSYIQQTAASIESKNSRLLSSAGRPPKKIIVDDNMPEKPAVKRHRPSNQ
jgi:predicted PurR-regulated permease PerM